jgi:hypothetical protein
MTRPDSAEQKILTAADLRRQEGIGAMLDELRKLLAPEIPMSAKVFGWILTLAGLFFAYVFTITPGSFFPGVTISTYSEAFGLYSTGVRILGSVLGIVIALVLNSAALLALMLATRIFIELGDVVTGLVVNQGAPDANTFILLLVAAIEAFFLVRLVNLLLKAK